MKRTFKIAVLLCLVAIILPAVVSCNELPLDMEPKFETFATTQETTPVQTTPETTTPEGTTPEETTPEEPVDPIDAAATYVYNLYKHLNVTAKDFDVTAKANVSDISFEVEWTVNTSKITIERKDKNTYTVNIDEESPQELPYVLTATIKASDGRVVLKTFYLTIPKYNLTSFEEYQTAKEGEIVIIKGVVVAMASRSTGGRSNNLFLADLDGKGGYYCYGILKDPIADLGIEVGMTVEVAGPIFPYAGMQEIKDGMVRITDATKKEVEPFDVTGKFTNGESLLNYSGALVTIRGVEIKHQDLETAANQYLYFELGENTSYIRTYVPHFPSALRIDVDETGALSSPDKTIIDAAHAEHFGWTANVTGIVNSYNGRQYLIPISVDCFEYLKEGTQTDGEKITEALARLDFESAFNSDAVIDLPAVSNAYSQVSFAWKSNNHSAVVENGKLNITIPDANTEVILTVTATCGDQTGTKEFLIKLFKDIVSIKDIIDLGMAHEHNTFTTNKFLVAGVITEVYNEVYGNMKITDDEGNILTIYGTYNADGTIRYNAMEVKPTVGEYVVVWGVVGQYSGVPQVKNGWIMSFATPTSIKDIIDLGMAHEHNTFTTNKFLVAGVITEVYNEVYGNMKITDDEGNILTIYGTYNADGTIRYDAMEVKPTVGEYVVVWGVVGQYNGVPQVKNGWIVTHTTTPE